MSLVSTREQQQPDILIAVMGPTGTGKSTFVNRASGFNCAPVGDNLISRTADVSYSPPFDVNGHRVILVDTPGFDDTVMSDIAILNKIALSLSITYKAGTRLSGIIFTHRISDNRMGGTMRKNFRMFKRLCGEETFRNVVIVTNFWGEVRQEVGEARERELCADEKLYKTILENGATMVRHDDTAQSARKILQQIINNYPLPLRIQKELVEEHKPMELTDAAVELDKERAERERQHLAEMRDIEQRTNQAIAAKDDEMKEIMEEWKEQVEEKMEEIRKEKKRAATMSAQYASDLSSMEGKLEQYEAKRAEREQKLTQLENQLADNKEQSVADKNVLLEQIRNLQQDSGGSFWGGFFGILGAVGAAALILL